MGQVDIVECTEEVREVQLLSEGLLLALRHLEREPRKLVVETLAEAVSARLGGVIIRLEEAENDS
ncbi:hypothetical protein [Microbulbifer agarilyticus]